ncbi:MAG: M50 family metallopeptidase [Syntrophomonadaceae bacterium]|jgi:stage IV sporulation protein FB|nr:M50 family metallopeptidase [Syntrophomonadaceae bacterium]
MKIAKIAGVTFKINVFLLLLLGLYSYLGWGKEMALAFSAVFLHELAHLAAGIFLKIKLTSIELFPFGGQAQVQDFLSLLPEKEIYLALIGPVFSLSVAGIFFYLPLLDYPFLDLFIKINFILGIFNFLPALPLDGGRILRAFLSIRLGFRKATQYTALAGQILGALFIIATGYFYYSGRQLNVNMILVGVFLAWAAYKEKKYLTYAFMRLLIHKKNELNQKGFLPSRQIVGYSNTLVADILKSVGPNYYMVVVEVDDNHNIVDMHSEAFLIDALLEKGSHIALKDC